MLSWQSVGELIKNGHPCDTSFLEELKKLSEKHPYSQTFSILYLNGLAANNDVSFDEELEKHAYKIFDRANLFNSIHNIDKEGSTSIDSSSKKTTMQIDVENKENEQELKRKEIVKEDHKKIETKEVEKKEEEIKPKKVLKNEETVKEIKGEEKKEILKEDNTEIETKEIKKKEEDIKPKKVLKSEEIVKEIKGEEKKEIEIPEDKENSSETKLKEVSKNKKFVEEKKQDNLNKTILSEIHKNTYQISDSKEKENTSGNRFEKEIDLSIAQKEIDTLKNEKIEALNSNSKTFNEWLTGSSIDSDVEHLKPKKVIYLEFDKPKKEFYSASKKAKESLLENNLPISETLAKIHAAQGNLEKAIHIYKQLQLLFPEKKAFFARQIKNLRSK